MEPNLALRRWRIDKTWRFHRSVMLAASLSDNDGVWASILSGAPVESDDRAMTSFPTDAVVYFPRGRWWTAIFMPSASPGLHVDIGVPSRISDDEIRTIDLDLDVVRDGGDVSVVDGDEFETHRVDHRYPDEVVVAARQAVVEVVGLVQAGRFPFDGISERARGALDAISR